MDWFELTLLWLNVAWIAAGVLLVIGAAARQRMMALRNSGVPPALASLMSDDEMDAWWRARELEASRRARAAARAEACPHCGATVDRQDKRCWNCSANLCKGCN